MGGIIVLIAALGFSLDSIFVRKGLIEENSGNVWDIRFISSLTTFILFVIGIFIAILFGFDLAEEFKLITFPAVLLLIMAGILGPLIGSLLMSMSIGQIGASQASALWGGSNPFFAALLAYFFLGEKPGLIGLFSILLIVIGITVIGYHRYEGTAMLLKKTKLAGGFIALLSGLSFSLSQVSRGAALKMGATPNTAFLVFFFTTAFLLLIITYFKNKGNLKRITSINRKSLYCYIFSGISVLVGAYGLLTAFTLIPVWQAIAIRNIQPLIVIILSWFFLKQVDRINLRLILGAFLVTVGVVILNIY
ncbi:MAG: EamA family transporter [Bacillota bacterium]|nr:EamA family transporter [Bacillota bacterium]